MIGYWGKRLLPGATGQPAPIDIRTVGFVLGVTALTAVVFGIAPALRATGINVNAALKETSRSVVGSRTLLTRMLLVFQVAVSLVLLIGAGLFLRTVQNLRLVDVGFNTRNLALFRVNPQLNQYDEKRSLLVYQQLLDQLGSVPGVRSVGFSQPALLAGSVNSTSLFVQGRTYAPDQRDNINRLVVTPNFFEMMEIPVVLGRGFTERDNETAPKVALINDAAVRRYFANQNPIGQRYGNSIETSGQIEIVGVLRDAKYNSVRDEAPPTVYVPYRQARMGAPVVRGADSRRSDERHERDSRRRASGGRKPAADERVHADRTGGTAVPAGEAVRAGVRPLRRHRLAPGRDRPVRVDVLQRRAPHQRDRHPHGARRRAPARAADGDGRVDGPRHHRHRPRRRRPRSLPAASSPACCSACRRPTRSR